LTNNAALPSGKPGRGSPFAAEKRFVVALLIIFSLITPAVANDIADCNQVADLELRIRGCTRFIQSGAKGTNIAVAYVNRGVAYNLNNNTDRAIMDFSKAIEVKPDFSLAYYNRGVAFAESGILDRAITDFDKAIQFGPEDPDAYDSRGFVYVDLRDFGRAIADFDKAIELDPSFGAAYYHRSLAYGAIGELDPGLADYNKALQLGCLRHGWCPPR